MPICGIYKITSPSGKCYIGQSVNIKKRWIRHCNNSECNAIKGAIDKYGRENMTFEIIQELPKNKVVMNSYEIYIIELYNSFSPNGYNLTSGGNSCSISEETKKKMSKAKKGKASRKGFLHTEESKEKMSEAKKGDKHPMYGKNHTEETKKKMSKSQKGENNPMYGKSFSEESKEKMSEAKKGDKHPMYGKNHTEETIKKMSEAKKGKSPPNKGKKFNTITRKYE